MKIIIKPSIIQKEVKLLKFKNKSIGFVPTMGALHQGHLSLIKRAKSQTDIVIVSIFVNPIQFGKGEDFSKYPRTLKRDKELLEDVGVDMLFVPNTQEFYKDNFNTYVEVKDLNKFMCAASREGHFEGVTTVVSKLFNIVQPDYSYFGQKDYQQLLVIKKMVQDLNYPVKVVTCPIVREKDGLAMSSRNKYLSSTERKSALCLYNSLKLVKRLIKKDKIRDTLKIKQKMRVLINKELKTKIDYIHFGDPETLEPIKTIKKNKKILIALAVKLNKTRLIDNIIV